MGKETATMDIDKMLEQFNDWTEQLETINQVRKSIDVTLKEPITNDELIAVLNSQIVTSVIATQIAQMRDPDYFSEESHGE